MNNVARIVIILGIMGLCLAAYAKEVPVQDFVVTMAGGSGTVSEGYGGCYLHLSNGTVLFNVIKTEPGLHLPGASADCYSFPVATHVKGLVDGKYLQILTVNNQGKEKRITYKIVGTSDAHTTQ